MGRVSKDEAGASWFETREDALLTMRGWRGGPGRKEHSCA